MKISINKSKIAAKAAIFYGLFITQNIFN